ncbi:MAG: V-type ATPase subunit [Clostridiales bacterium]|nr:V-type ATPase subunit [Clostridiales bacterium]
MPQISIPYAVGRVRMISQQALDTGKLNRLVAAKTYDDAKRTLSEIGWGGVQGKDDEQLSIEYVEQAYELVKKITPAEKITDCFLIRYDIHNIKTLIKARELKIKVEFLSNSGMIPLGVLEHAINERVYEGLGETVLTTTLNNLEEILAKGFDPFAVDTALDQGMYQIVFDRLKIGKAKGAVRNYFVAKVDLVNVVILLRSVNMKKEVSFFQEAWVPFGTFSWEQWKSFYEEPEKMISAMEKYGEKVTYALRAAVKNAAQLPMFEKAIDNHLLTFFLPYQRDVQALEAFLGYLLQVEREAAAIRLVMAAKANDFSAEALQERMRDLYGQP